MKETSIGKKINKYSWSTFTIQIKTTPFHFISFHFTKSPAELYFSNQLVFNDLFVCLVASFFFYQLMVRNKFYLV